MNVTRVHTDHGSHIEPPLDHRWDDLAKLRWHAAVVSHDTGLQIQVRGGQVSVRKLGNWRPIPGQYVVYYPGGSATTGGFNSTWSYLNGISAGARAARQPAPDGGEESNDA